MSKLIDANNLITCLKIMSTKNDSTVWGQCIEIVNSLPDEQKHGHWVKPKGSLWDIGTCSVCGEFSVEGEKALYCPHCGAKMDGE